MSETRVFPIISHLVNHESLNGLSKVETYLEIGVSDGFTLQCRLNENPELKEMVLCDTWGATDGGTNRGSHEHIVTLLETAGYPLDRATFLDGDSKQKIPEYFGLYPSKVFDLVFVDGDHTEMGLWMDLVNTVQHGHIIAVHDVRNPNHPTLRDVFYTFYETVRERFIAVDDGYDLCALFSRELFNWE